MLFRSTLQELPYPIDDAAIAAMGLPTRVTLLHRMESGRYHRHLAIIASGGIEGTRKRDDIEKKVIGVSALLPGIGAVDVFCVHAISRATEDNADD